MAVLRPYRALLLLSTLVVASSCASAEDRLNEGVDLQARGRHMEAVYRYAEAVEKDPTLTEARERLVAAGDSAFAYAMEEADALESRGDPVAAAERYRAVDRMAARIRSAGVRYPLSREYQDRRRQVFDGAVQWLMAEGREAEEEGRWEDAHRAYAGVRGGFEASRDQVDASLDAETRLLLSWAAVELEDGRPRAAWIRAQQATEVRPSTPRDVVLETRELQDRALAEGTVVVATLPVTAAPHVREHFGPELEIHIDDVLARHHWVQPPLFVEMADPLLLEREMRALLRGRAPRSSILVGRAVGLIGADLGVVVEVDDLEILEGDVQYETRVARRLPAPGGVRRREADTAVYREASGWIEYRAGAVGTLVDVDGRELASFRVEARERGPFRRGEYEGDPSRLDLDEDQASLFDPRAQAAARAHLQRELAEHLAVRIAGRTYETVLAGVP